MDTYHTDIRLQLLANGYAIIPNRGKIPVLVGWNEPDYVTKQLTDNAKGIGGGAGRRAGKTRFSKAVSTGIRIENGLGVIDVDVDDAGCGGLSMDSGRRHCAGRVCERAPDPVRRGRPQAGAVLRIEGERWVRIASRRYNGHCVEIFGGAPLRSGNCSRQFGILGPHSFNDDGSVARTYEWARRRCMPTTCRSDELPTLTKAQAFADRWPRSRRRWPAAG